MKYYCFIISACILPFSSYTQSISPSKDTILIPTIHITDQFYPVQHSYLSQKDSSWTRNFHYQDAGVLLNNLTPIYLRNYGPGLIYSLSIRGGNSAQTSVLWNGININNPMQGQTDLSLVKLNQGTILRFHPNTYENALTGSIDIREQFNQKKGFSYSFTEELSSMTGHEFSANATLISPELKTGISCIINNSQNNFGYRINGQHKIQSHNAIDHKQLKYQIEKTWNRKHHLAFHSWVQKTVRQIPPSLYEKKSDAIQDDSSLKLLGNYSYSGNKYSFQYKSAFLSDKLLYNSHIKSIYSDSHSKRFVQQLQSNFLFGKNTESSVKLEHDLNIVSSNAYKSITPINYIHLSGKFKWNISNSHSIITGLKTGMKDDKASPLAPYFYYSFSPNRKLKLLLSAGRKYRYPGFNDLFWSIGGNESLLPEKAIETEFGVIFKPNELVVFENRFYYKSVTDWIQWLPINGVFQAQNISKVQGKGMETSFAYTIQSNPFTLQSRLFYHLNMTEKKSEEGKGLQLIYTPNNLLKHNIQLTWKAWQFQLDHSLTGRIYTATDHSEYLASFYLMNLNLERKIKIRKHSLSFWFNVANVFNQEYFTIKNYVMPGRNYRLGISLRN